MNKRRFLKATATGLIALMTTGLFATTANAADKVRLRFQTYYGTELDHITKKFAKSVKEESNGTLRIMVFRGGELVPNGESLQAVSRGTLDMAHNCGCYFGGKLDIANLESGLPGAWANYDEARELFHEKGLLDLVKESYAEKGVVYLTNGHGSDYDLLSKKPVATLDDLKSMKVRTTGNVAKVFKKLDIDTVNLPSQEFYVAMSTGVIDAVLYGGTLDYKNLKLNELATNYTTVNMLTPGWTENYIINQASWNKLSDQQKSILKKATDQMARDISDWYAQGNLEARKAAGFQFSELPAQDTARIVAASQEVWDEEAKVSERNAQAVEILRAYAKEKGRL